MHTQVENTIRWRYSQDESGNEIRESNARIVKWSDGTMSLYLGGEIFDIYKQQLAGEFSHLFVRQGRLDQVLCDRLSALRDLFFISLSFSSRSYLISLLSLSLVYHLIFTTRSSLSSANSPSRSLIFPPGLHTHSLFLSHT